MTEDMATRVAKGVALLDEHVPGWPALIDLERLDFWSLTDCVLGQIYGRATRPLYMNGMAMGDYGFNTIRAGADPAETLAALTEAWRSVVAERQAHA